MIGNAVRSYYAADPMATTAGIVSIILALAVAICSVLSIPINVVLATGFSSSLTFLFGYSAGKARERSGQNGNGQVQYGG